MNESSALKLPINSEEVLKEFKEKNVPLTEQIKTLSYLYDQVMKINEILVNSLPNSI